MKSGKIEIFEFESTDNAVDKKLESSKGNKEPGVVESKVFMAADKFWSKFDEVDRMLGRIRCCDRISSNSDGIFADFANHDLPEIASTIGE